MFLDRRPSNICAVNGILYDTYHDACRELNLLEDDNHWDITLADSALSSSPNKIRNIIDEMFSITSFCSLGQI